jgi:hypothetical protein
MMMPAGGNEPQLRNSEARRGPAQLWWAAVPVVSMGFLAFVPFLAYAIRVGRKRDWALFATYLAVTVAMIVTVGVVNSNSGASAGVGGFVIALAGCAAIHACILFRPARSMTPRERPVRLRDRNRAAVKQARAGLSAGRPRGT